MTLTVERLKEFFIYDPDTGYFTSQVNKGRINIGKIVGVKPNNKKGYILIGIDGTQYYAHRLAWLYMTGEWPKNLIDHIDLNKRNNVWENLREATNAENLRNRGKNKNNTTGYKGIHKNRNGYMVRICIGTYKTKEEAAKIYEEAVKLYHGKFARLQ